MIFGAGTGASGGAFRERGFAGIVIKFSFLDARSSRRSAAWGMKV